MKRTELDILVEDFVSEILIKTFKNESDLTFVKRDFTDKIENEINREKYNQLCKDIEKYEEALSFTERIEKKYEEKKYD